MPQVEVEFAIDANGILNVTATDKKTNKSQNIEIKGSSGLSKEEIERMKVEAESHAGEDKQRRELIDLKNRAEMILYSTRKSLEEHGGKVSADVRGSIESAISNLESKVKADDKEAIEAALRQLENAAMELGKAVYEATSAGVGTPGSQGVGSQGAATGAPAGGADEDIIDAEYEVKDDEKS